MPVKLGFDIRAIVPVCFMFVAMTMNTMACVSALTKIALGRKITHREVTGALNCDGLGSSLAAIFGVLPNTAFTQNIGMVNMTRIVNRYSVLMGAIFLILCGFCPKLMSVISIMPPAVLGGVVCYMFGTILVGGIELLGDEGFGPRNTTIIAVSIGVAFALGDREGSLVGLPSWFSSLFASSGVAFAAFSALVLNIVLPKGKKGGQAGPAADDGSHCRRSGGFERRYHGGDHTGIRSVEGLIAPLPLLSHAFLFHIPF